MNVKIESGIYAIFSNINKYTYIGKAVNLSTRYSEHLRDLRNKRHHNYLLQQCFNEYGDEHLSFHILEYVERTEDLLYHEQLWINKLYKADIPIINIQNPVAKLKIDRRMPKPIPGRVFKDKSVTKKLSYELFRNLINNSKSFEELNNKLSELGFAKYDGFIENIILDPKETDSQKYARIMRQRILDLNSQNLASSNATGYRV